jgi:membrane-associated phospholipid phosphatase
MRQPAYALLVTVNVWVGIALIPCDASAQILAPMPAAPPVSGSAPTFGAPPASDFTPSLGRIFADTLTDFRRLPSLDSAVILSIGGLTAMAGHPYDARVSGRFSSADSMRGMFGAGQTIGAASTQLAGAFATYSIGRMTGHPKVAMIGADLVRAQFVSQAMTQAIKLGVGRTRPDGTSLSFPSGHSASAFATAAVLQRHLGWKAGIPAYAVAGYVAASRIQVQRHYLSDVAFGAAIGIVAGRTVTIGHGDMRFAVSPAAAPGGGGVNFTWVGKK